MKKILSVMLALLLMLSCCAFFAPRSAEASLESDLAAARKKLEEAEKRVAQLQKQIEEAKNDQKRQIEAKITMEEQVAALDEQMEAMETVLEELKQDLSEKEAALAETREELSEAYAAYRRRVRANYEAGQTSFLEVLLTSKSLSEMMTRIDLLTQISEYDQKLMNSISDSIARQEQLTAQVQQSVEEQTRIVNAIEATKQEQAAKLKEIERALEQLAANAERYEEEEARYERLMIEYDKKIDALLDALKRYNGGELLWPIQAGKYSRITSPFGWRTLFGKREFHAAIDIGAYSGTPVVAAADGKVLWAKWIESGAGNQVVIDHGNGLSTRYNHLKGFACKTGQEVKKGDVIGYVGSTGNSTGPHLDFRIRYDGHYYNPLDFITKDNEGKAPYSINDIFNGKYPESKRY